MSYSKKNRLIASVILAPILFFVVCLPFASCTLDKDIKADEAIAIAKNDFGCEKILWIKSNALILSQSPEDEPSVNTMRSHYSYYVVAEKDGNEIYLVIPSTPKLDKPYITTWCMDYSFKQIVHEFNKLGAQYVIDVPDDYYSAAGNYINIETVEDMITGYAKYHEVDDAETFYERLDVKAVFNYRRVDNDYIHDYMLAQIDGELKTYEQTQPVQ